MIDTGAVFRADLGEERPRRVLILSSHRFSTITGRAIVAPEWTDPLGGPLPPWRVLADGQIYAVDRIVSLSRERLLQQVGDAPYGAVADARRALLAIT